MDNITQEASDLIEKVTTLVEGPKRASAFVPGESIVRYAGPTIDGTDIVSFLNAAVDSVSTGQFATGQNTRNFEKKLSEVFGVDGSVFVNSGSSANLISIATLCATGRLEQGDEVITTAATFPTTVNPLLLYHLKPVVIDVQLPSYTIDLGQLSDAITPDTKAIMVTHLNGSANDMDTIMEIANTRGLQVIEDTCDAIGSRFNGRYLGTWGHIASMSFYAAHHMTTGEGGAVLTSDNDLLNHAISLRDWGRSVRPDNLGETDIRKIEYQNASSELPSDYEARFTYTTIGYNLKPLDMQGALGLAQLGRVPQFTRMRQHNYLRLYQGLKKHEQYLVLPEALPKADVSWFVFPLVVREDAPFERVHLTSYLEERKIETRPILAGNIVRQPAYKNVEFQIRSDLVISDLITRGGFFVGTWPGLGDPEIDYILSVFDSFCMRF